MKLENLNLIELDAREVTLVNGGELPFTENACKVDGKHVVNFFKGLWDGLRGK